VSARNTGPETNEIIGLVLLWAVLFWLMPFWLARWLIVAIKRTVKR